MNPMNLNIDGEDVTSGGGASQEQPSAQEERKFTQADLDRAAAEARRKGEAAASKKAQEAQEKFKTSLLEEFDKRMNARLEVKADPVLVPVKEPVQAQAKDPVLVPVKEPVQAQAKDPAQVQAQAQAQIDPSILELRAQLGKLSNQLEHEKAERKKIESGLSDEKKLAKEAAERARKAEVTQELVSELENVARIPNKTAQGLAQILLVRDQISIQEKKAYWKTGEIDEDGNEKLLPLKDGVAQWGKSDEADQYRPPLPTGSGHVVGTHTIAPPKLEDFSRMSETERWKAAAELDRQKRAQQQRR